VRAGGKVVKNVAGYDLAKLYIGSLGTLGVIVEATLKLRPRPEADRACWAAFDGVGAAAAAARVLMAADLVPHSLELLDPAAAARCGPAAGVPSRPGAALLVGFDGLASTVASQLTEAERLLLAAGAQTVTALADADQALAVVRDVRGAVREPLAVARAALLPSEVGRYVTEASTLGRSAGLEAVITAHVGNGVVQMILAPGDGEPAPGSAAVKVLTALRDLAHAAGGELVVEWAPLALKEELRPWDAAGPAVRLMERIKAQIDPKGIMNPGRFVGTI
jgi:glycolate oxidase FAD binding subunit